MQQAPGLPLIKKIEAGGFRGVELTVDGLQPMVFPSGAPNRFKFTRIVEMTDFKSWDETAALFAPLYEKASVLPPDGPLREEISRIKSLSNDPKQQTEAVLALVQDNIRYVFLGMNSGGLVPADAATTWSRRFGDCKAKTALLLALLHALKIEAEPVAVSVGGGDGLNERLPMVGYFNHVLVRAMIGGRVYWLDGTRTGDRNIELLRIPNFGWGLPLVSKGAALIRMVPPPLDEPTQTTTIAIDASAGISLPAPFRVETIMRGDAALGTHLALKNMTADMRDQALRSYWRGQYNFVDVVKVTTTFDPKSGEERLTMDGTAQMRWKGGWYETDGTSVGWDADFHRDPGPNQDAPFAVDYPLYSRNIEIIILPKSFGISTAKLPADVNQTTAGMQYRRLISVSADTFKIEVTRRSVEPEFPAAGAVAAQAALRKLNDDTVYLRKPDNYWPSDAEVTAVLSKTLTTSDDILNRANMLLDRKRYDEAILDFDRALAIDSKNARAFAQRGLSFALIKDFERANADFNAAAAIQPRSAIIFRGRGVVAQMNDRFAEAVDAYTASLEMDPSNLFTLNQRARTYLSMEDTDHALADVATAIRLYPTSADMYLLRAYIFMSNEKMDEAKQDFDRALSADPNNVTALSYLALYWIEQNNLEEAAKVVNTAKKIAPDNGDVLYSEGMIAQTKGAFSPAIAAFNQIIRADPNNVDALTQRALARHGMRDDNGAMEDATLALNLNPKLTDLRLLRANIYQQKGQIAEALGEAEALISINTNDGYPYVVAAMIYVKNQKIDEAMHQFDHALSIKPEPYIYLNRSQVRPKTDISGRLADLDAALKLDPKFSEALAEKASILGETGKHGDVAHVIKK
jgi:tetratricopeptide (TPR) repeat protein